MFARIKLDEEQRDRAISLVQQIEDWDAFVARAAEYFIAPLCLYHLGQLGDDPKLQSARAALRKQAMPMTMRTLQLAALQRRFVENHILPLQIPFAVIKGRGLAARYYPDAGLRFARDLDVLVPVERIPSLIMRSQMDGYTVYPDRRPLSSDEAHMLSRKSKVVTLIGEEGILIEVHAQLDKAGFLLDHRSVLQRAEQIQIDGVPTGILKTADHFVYICLHHTKHFWSRLSWLADLDALMQSPDFDLAEVMDLARDRGVEKTVAASIGFHEACAAKDPWSSATDRPEVLDLLRACLVILEQGASREFEMRPDRLSLDFNFAWQFPAGFERRERWRSRLTGISPSLADYHAWPLPRKLHWLYFVIRPFRLLFRDRTSNADG
ncbi:MAG: nucleotidyltransferase family protein [Wenzhouxiangella sp.]